MVTPVPLLSQLEILVGVVSETVSLSYELQPGVFQERCIVV